MNLSVLMMSLSPFVKREEEEEEEEEEEDGGGDI
jgi:hypothetical protein